MHWINASRDCRLKLCRWRPEKFRWQLTGFSFFFDAFHSLYQWLKVFSHRQNIFYTSIKPVNQPASYSLSHDSYAADFDDFFKHKNTQSYLKNIWKSLGIPRISFQRYHLGNFISLAMQNPHRFCFILRAFQSWDFLNHWMNVVGNPEMFMNIEQCKTMKDKDKLHI